MEDTAITTRWAKKIVPLAPREIRPDPAPGRRHCRCANGIYRPRRPRETAFYRLVEEHFERYDQVYPERYEDRYSTP